RAGQSLPLRAGGGQRGSGSRSTPYGSVTRQPNLYVLNKLSGHVTQYAINADKGTLTLVVKCEFGAGGGRPRLGPCRRRRSVPHRRPPPPRRRTTSQKSGRLTFKVTPNGKFLYSTERTTNKIALFTIARLEPAILPMSAILRPRHSRAASGSIRPASISSRRAKSRTAYRSNRPKHRQAR